MVHYLALLSKIKSSDLKVMFRANAQDIEDISILTSRALKLSSGAEETRNLGYIFTYQKAQYLACSDDLKLLKDA